MIDKIFFPIAVIMVFIFAPVAILHRAPRHNGKCRGCGKPSRERMCEQCLLEMSAI